MKFVAVVMLAGAMAMAQKKPQLKPPELTLSETSIKREEGKILLDGKLRNVGERPAKGVTIFFDFLDPDRKVLATKKAELEPDSLEPQEDAEFHAQMEEPARVTHVRLRFEDKDGRDVRAANTGPYAIE
jgi:hypothetical protein